MAMAASIFKGPGGFVEVCTYDSPDRLGEFLAEWLRLNRIKVGETAVRATRGRTAGGELTSILVPPVPGDMQGLAVMMSLAGDLNGAGFDRVDLIDETPGTPASERLMATVKAQPARGVADLGQLGAGAVKGWDEPEAAW
jgi:hypothetical protein